MAELETAEQPSASCCSPSAQESCCQPEAKSECCGDGHEQGCGCSAGRAEGDDVREVVRERYAAAALAAGGAESSSCCGDAGLLTEDQRAAFGSALYEGDERDALPEAAKLASLGCGNPTAVAELHPGETVLDLGSGGGIDVLLSARRVGPTGKAYGLDMTDEMLELARHNQREAGLENVEFVKGTIEDVPLADGSVDVIISNCVINLSGDKPRVLREAARVLRPGGRLAVSDVVADPGMDEATRRDMQQWTGCIAGALTREDFERELAAAGFEAIEIRETHRVHDQAASAIIRARKPRACTLGPADQVERVRDARALAAERLVAAEVTDRGATLRFEREAEPQLRALIAAESQCCSFLEFELRESGDELELTVSGEESDRPVALALFGLSG